MTASEPADIVRRGAGRLREQPDAPSHVRMLATMLAYVANSGDLPDAVLAARLRAFALEVSREVLQAPAGQPCEELPGPGERVDLEALLRAGGSALLTFEAGEDGEFTSDGEVVHPAEPGGFLVTARDGDAKTVGCGTGDSPTEAIRCLRRYATAPADLHAPAPPF